METVISRDGTQIAFSRSGSGPPLVLVHGTSASHTRWDRVLARLEDAFTVIALDRRGRGASGDGADYAIEREFEDVAAVVDALAEPAFLFGHSYGAICALEATTRTGNVARLALYEPPIVAEGEGIFAETLLGRLDRLLAAGDRAGVVRTFLAEVVQMPESELALIEASPAWPAREGAAHTLPRELRAQDAYRADPARLARIAVPVLLLLGGDSPPFFRTAIDRLADTIADARTVVLPGQKHIAMDTAPELLIGAVLDFARETA